MSEDGQALCVTKDETETVVKVFPFAAIQSIQTLKRLGHAVFQLKCCDRHDVVYRFQDQDQMNDWLFEFQRSIAKIVHHWICWTQERPGLDSSRSSSSVQIDDDDTPSWAKRTTALHRRMSLDFVGGESGSGSGPGPGPSLDHDDDDDGLSMSSSTRPLAIMEKSSNPNMMIQQQQRSSPTSQLLSSRDYMASISPTSPLHDGLRSMKEELDTRFHQATSCCRSSSERSSKSDELMQFEFDDGHEEEEEEEEESKSSSLEEKAKPSKVGWTSLVGNRKSNEDVCCCIENLAQYLEKQSTNHHRRSRSREEDLDEIGQAAKSSGRIIIDQLYGVFDGHSGALAADFVKEHLPSTLAESPYFHTDLPRAFRETFASLDAAFLEEVQKVDRYDGTTVALVLLRGSTELWTANVGDSKAVMGRRLLDSDSSRPFSSSGTRRRRSDNHDVICALDIIVDQTPGRPDERARIEAQGGWVTEERELQMSRLHSMDLQDPEIRQEALEQVVKWITIYRVNGELAVSRSIGDPDYKHPGLNGYPWAYPPESSARQSMTFVGSDLVLSVPEVRRYDLRDVSGEFIIIASDGLWDIVESQKAVEFVANCRARDPGISPEEASAKLAALALRLGSADNVSVLIVFLQ